jgi:hypothetical protein
MGAPSAPINLPPHHPPIPRDKAIHAEAPARCVNGNDPQRKPKKKLLFCKKEAKNSY